MTDARIMVRFAGPQVSVQDGGRPGLMRFGVPASGAMDRKALTIANLALGNDPGAPGIEVSRGGLEVECLTRPVTLALAGGGFICEVGGQKSGSWQVLTVSPGQRLRLRPGPWGSWCYIAFAGQLQTQRWLGSAATHALSGFGGGNLVAGAEVVVSEPHLLPARSLPCPVWARPRAQVHVTLGPQDRYFSAESLTDFLSKPFTLTDAYDRMGVRLRGPALPPIGALSIPSEPILRGSVQVAGDGVATVLLADHQTTGGYPKIATVLDDDLDGFAQLRPQQAVRFQAVPPAQAVTLARHRAAIWTRYCAALRG